MKSIQNIKNQIGTKETFKQIIEILNKLQNQNEKIAQKNKADLKEII